jgi:hypothetical protein
VAEQGCLLSSCPGKTRAGGSNPPLSAFVINNLQPIVTKKVTTYQAAIEG